MASKRQAANTLTTAQLRRLVDDYDLEPEGDEREDLINAVVRERHISGAEVAELSNADIHPDDVDDDPNGDDAGIPSTGQQFRDEEDDEDDEESDIDTSNPVVGDVPAQGLSGPTAQDADEASPTGGANTAGTPQSQLDQAPPMQDPSGSNIPAPNLRQPVAEGVLEQRASDVNADSLDPALVDPEGQARERVEGRTSDAATRAEGTQIDEVPPDLGQDTKPSDGGPEAYPFPQGGDVEVATVDPGSGEGEYMRPLEVEDWVILGEHDVIPDVLVGARAAVLDAPRYLIREDQKDLVWITVRTRDEYNATLNIPLSAVDRIERNGTGGRR